MEPFLQDVKNRINRTLSRHLGVSILRVHASENSRVDGSFPSLKNYYAIGPREKYYIRSDYRPRTGYVFLNTSGHADEAQEEVYRYAHELALREDVKTVCDFGCGNGYKLLKFFRGMRTIGVDVPETVCELRKKYRERTWVVSDDSWSAGEHIGIVIAADVIEHLEEPDRLMQQMARIAPSWVVLSTPDRNLLKSGHTGPPTNIHHIREWSMPEFFAYVSQYFRVVDHFISNPRIATQCIVGRLRTDDGSPRLGWEHQWKPLQ